MTREIWLRRNRTTGWYEVMAASEALVTTPWLATRFALRAKYGGYRPPSVVARSVAHDFPDHEVVYIGMV